MVTKKYKLLQKKLYYEWLANIKINKDNYFSPLKHPIFNTILIEDGSYLKILLQILKTLINNKNIIFIQIKLVC